MQIAEYRVQSAGGEDLGVYHKMHVKLI